MLPISGKNVQGITGWKPAKKTGEPEGIYLKWNMERKGWERRRLSVVSKAFFLIPLFQGARLSTP
jgi:hypothetical protein